MTLYLYITVISNGRNGPTDPEIKMTTSLKATKSTPRVSPFKILQGDNGMLVLFVFARKRCIYAHDYTKGYYTSGQLSDDYKALMSGESPNVGWDGNDLLNRPDLWNEALEDLCDPNSTFYTEIANERWVADGNIMSQEARYELLGQEEEE